MVKVDGIGSVVKGTSQKWNDKLILFHDLRVEGFRRVLGGSAMRPKYQKNQDRG